MIKIENIDVTGWNRSDSYFDSETGSYIPKDGYIITTNKGHYYILRNSYTFAKAFTRPTLCNSLQNYI